MRPGCGAAARATSLPCVARGAGTGGSGRRAAAGGGAGGRRQQQAQRRVAAWSLPPAAGEEKGIEAVGDRSLHVGGAGGAEELLVGAIGNAAARHRRAWRASAKAKRELLGQGVGLAGASGAMLTAATAAAGLATPIATPLTVGALLGALAADRASQLAAPKIALGLVITGSTRGVGRALAREHLWAGDHVVVSGRSADSVASAVRQLVAETGCDPGRVKGVACDVTSAADVKRLAEAAEAFLAPIGGVGVWVNNAAASGSFQPFVDAEPEALGSVVRTNLLGTLYGTQAACKLFKARGVGGHIFNVDGAGADYGATPFYAAYGSTKAGTRQLLDSVRAELRDEEVDVALHALSPGMVLTELLLEGATSQNKQLFNVLCEQPETVAGFLVPRVRATAAAPPVGGSGRYYRYLTPLKALYSFAAYPSRKGRFFDSNGDATFKGEHERIAEMVAARDEAAAATSGDDERAGDRFWTAFWTLADVAGLPLRYAWTASLVTAFALIDLTPSLREIVDSLP